MIAGDEREDMGISENVSRPRELLTQYVTRYASSRARTQRTPEQLQRYSQMTKRKVQPSSESESEAQLSTDSEPKSRPPAKKKATAVSQQFVLPTFICPPMPRDRRKQRPTLVQVHQLKIRQRIRSVSRFLFTTTRSAISIQKATSSASVHKSVEGDKYIDLGKKKRATVRSLKDIPLLDIREFYGTGSEEKPGKKGISLTLEQVSEFCFYRLFAPEIVTVARAQGELGYY